jgi:hypothetical protein
MDFSFFFFNFLFHIFSFWLFIANLMSKTIFICLLYIEFITFNDVPNRVIRKTYFSFFIV